VKACPTCHIDNPLDSRFCQNCGSPLAEVSGVPEDPYIGRKFAGKFMIQKSLGQGAMGRVYLAEHLSLGKPVCIKILHPHLAGDENIAKRFHREARAASRLSHSNSIQILDFGPAEDGTLYLAMEYVPGSDLRRVIRRDVPFPSQRIARILGGVLSALEEAHVQGVIHRDLKPENIMVVDTRTEKDVVKVLDFGIAKIQDPGVEGGTLTVAGLVCGTPEYMAPEQARGDPLDNRVDIYAAGVILYQMLTGELPFKAESALATVTKHLTEPPIPPHERRPDIPVDRRLEAICLKAMAKDRRDRFASAAEMKEALEDGVMVTGERRPSGQVPKRSAPPGPGDSQWAVGPVPEAAEAAEPGGGPSPTQTPLAFAVEEGRPVHRDRSGGSIAAWLTAIGIVVLGGVAVALWKLEVGPFAPKAETIQVQPTAQPPPEPPAPAPVKVEDKPPPSPEPKKVAPKPEPPKPEKRAREEEVKKPRRRTVARAPAEDPEASLKSALSQAASSSRPEPQVPKPEPKNEPARSAARDPMKAQSSYEAGLRALGRSQINDAIVKLREAVQLDPSSPEYHRDLAKAYMRANNKPAGKAEFKKYLRLYPDAPDADLIKRVVASP
jgi:serine/threonine-protein kinase